jgi:soluble lytic murein transglycosylase-like protein
MRRGRIKNYFSGRNWQAMVFEYGLTGILVVIGLALTSALFTPCEHAHADYLLSAHRVRVEKAPADRAVLQWMKENSHVPQQVLFTVYHTALNSVNPDLVLAICVVESNFNPRAQSDKGAVGLMGIMPTVWLDSLKARGIVNDREDLYVIPNNIAAGVFVLNWYVGNKHNLREALRGYSGGDPAYAGKVLRAVERISRVRRSAENVYFASAREEDFKL